MRGYNAQRPWAHRGEPTNMVSTPATNAEEDTGYRLAAGGREDRRPLEGVPVVLVVGRGGGLVLL